MCPPDNDPRPDVFDPSSSLLYGVRNRVPEAWARLVRLCAPVVARWCGRFGVRQEDRDDVLQEVFRAVARTVADFRRDHGSFSAWLYTITRTKSVDHFRRQQQRPLAVGGSDFLERMHQVPEPEDASVQTAGSALLIRRALDLVRTEFEESTWQAFWRTTVEGQTPDDVANALGLSVNAVYMARSKVRKRLHQELEGLVE